LLCRLHPIFATPPRLVPLGVPNTTRASRQTVHNTSVTSAESLRTESEFPSRRPISPPVVVCFGAGSVGLRIHHSEAPALSLTTGCNRHVRGGGLGLREEGIYRVKLRCRLRDVGREGLNGGSCA
jgi:hypothetical protein